MKNKCWKISSDLRGMFSLFILHYTLIYCFKSTSPKHTNLSFINLIHFTKDTEYCKLSYDADGIIPSNICTDCKDYIGIRDNEVDSYIQY